MKPHLPKPSTPAMNDPAPQTLIRKVVDACADCDTCRFLMNDDCLFFPALYRLVDNEAKTGRPSSDHELRQLVECCTLCGLCPCPNIRTEVMRAKSAFVDQSGMSLKNRLLVDVQRFGQACGMIPSLAHAALNTRSAKRIAKRLAGIHPDRRLPVPSKESFFAWAKRKGLGDHPVNSRGVAYFSGCTAGYLFPEVAKAAVTVLQRCNISVYVPPQHCCGMPSLVEGDMRTTRRRAGSNVDSILVARRLGYDPVCSCPTCGFLMKVLLKEGACYSDSYQRSVGADGTEIKIPDGTGNGGYSSDLGFGITVGPAMHLETTVTKITAS